MHKTYHSLQLIFVCNEHEIYISFITIFYYSIRVTLFIFYMTGIFLMEQDEIER